ncbi:MAG: hypothetical protein AAF389_13395 [Gemmatimonadota bacterium]
MRRLVTVLLLTVAACGGPGDGPVQGAPELLEIAGPPRSVLGLDAQNPDAVLNHVVDATWLTDGSIVVANGGLATRLPIFSAEGDYLRLLGRQGDGPGEFRWVSSVEAGTGDSLFVFDASLQRLTAVASDGGMSVRPVRAVASGHVRALRWVNQVPEGWIAFEMDMPMSGEVGVIIRDTIDAGVLSEDMTDFEPFVTLPALMSTTMLLGGRRGFGSPAFAPQVLQAAWGRCVFVVADGSHTVNVYSSRGRVVTSFRGPGTSREATADDFERWVDYRVSLSPNDEDMLRSSYREVARLETLPAYSQIVADEWGRVWLQEYTPGTTLGRRWFVYSQRGRHLADVQVPKRLRVFEISTSGLLGAALGDFGEEYIEVYDLADLPTGGADALDACVVE